MRTRPRGSATLQDSSAVGYSNTFEAESPTQPYSNTFESESGAAGEASAALRRRDGEAQNDIVEETPGEVSSSSSIAQELGPAQAEEAASRTASAHTPTGGQAPEATSAERADSQGHGVAAGASGGGQEDDDEAYSDSFVGESASQSMLADAAREPRALASPSSHKFSGENDDLDKTGVYSDSFVGIDSHEAGSVLAQADAAAASGQVAPEAESVGGDSVATDISGMESDVQDERHVQAADCLQQHLRSAMARRSMLAQLLARRNLQQQQQEEQLGAVEQAEEKRQDLPAPTAASSSPGSASGGAAHESIAEDSMEFSDNSMLDKSATGRDGASDAASPSQGQHRQQASPGSSAAVQESGPSVHAVEEGIVPHMAVDVGPGEDGCPPVSSPPLSPSKAPAPVLQLQQRESEMAPSALAAHVDVQREDDDPAAAAQQMEDAEAAAAQARESTAAQMVLVSDALLAEVLAEMMASMNSLTAPVVASPDSPPLPSSPAAVEASSRQAELAQATMTPSPDKRPDSAPGSGHSSQGTRSLSPGALALMAPLESPTSSPGQGIAAGRDDGQAQGELRTQADEAMVSAAELAMAASSKSSSAAVSYASILLQCLDAACYSEGLGDDVFLDVARSKFSSMPQDQHVFHKLIFDVIKSEMDRHARAASARRPIYEATPSAYGSQVPMQMTVGLRSQVDREVLDVVQRLAASGDFAGDEGAEGLVPGAQLDLTALQALVDADLIRMEKEWVQYEEEEDVIKIAVADAILDDLLVEVTTDLVASS